MKDYMYMINDEEKVSQKILIYFISPRKQYFSFTQ